MATDSGVEIRLFGGNLGRAAVATKSFNVGDVVMVDLPVLAVADSPLSNPLSWRIRDVLQIVADENPDAVVPVDLQANILAEYSHLSQDKRNTISTNFAAAPIDVGHGVVEILGSLASSAQQNVAELGYFSIKELHHFLLVMATNAHEFIENGQLYIGLYDQGLIPLL
ncbi:hypothetical protein SpCBS45565_g06253 [Spizellomyces sp. 'palustris']|nr:hypothetical protein SpCBS45565_g06253 [Spizellomyces sp. 'palustris']